MAFISVDEELLKRSYTNVENKFINKYLAELEPVAVKVYILTLYFAQSGKACSLEEFSAKLNIPEAKIKEYFEYLSEMQLVSIPSYSPFEVKVLDCENYGGTPKKLHPEKYEGLYEELQSIITARNISPNEFREYLILLEDFGFERNALVMLINYCVNYKGADIGGAYIKQVAKNFYSEGITTSARVEERLSSYTMSTAPLLKIFTACAIKRRPAIEDGALYEKWVKLGFSEESVISAAKCFKIKKLEKLDGVIEELYKNKMFDPLEIADYARTKDSLFNTAVSVAKSLGVYASDLSPYVENYISVWHNYGFSTDAIKNIAGYCFLSGKNSFDLMNDFVQDLYNDAYVDDESIATLLEGLVESDKFIKRILSLCGLTRKIIPYDRQALARWRNWGFSDSMILKAAELSATKNNPVAAMNYLLSSWKNGNVFTVEQIPAAPSSKNAKAAQKERDTDIYKKLYAKLANEENNDAT